jgi:hypothetical protein
VSAEMLARERDIEMNKEDIKSKPEAIRCVCVCVCQALRYAFFFMVICCEDARDLRFSLVRIDYKGLQPENDRTS